MLYFHTSIHFYLMDQDVLTAISVFAIVTSIAGICYLSSFCYHRRRDPSPSMLDEREIEDLTEA